MMAVMMMLEADEAGAQLSVHDAASSHGASDSVKSSGAKPGA
jgi:hypothetical protein